LAAWNISFSGGVSDEAADAIIERAIDGRRIIVATSHPATG
jgi:hypothetical protein